MPAARKKANSKSSILFVLLITTFLTGVAAAQTGTRGIFITGKSIPQLRKPSAEGLFFLSRSALLHSRPSTVRHSPVMMRQKPIYSYDELGVFCKLEVQMERAFGLPVKFRLGEVQYVERMEGKY